jgi:hypothetical protein
MPNAVFLPSWQAIRVVGSILEDQPTAAVVEDKPTAAVDPPTPARDFRKKREFDEKASTSGMMKSHAAIRTAQRPGIPLVLVDIASTLLSLETTAALQEENFSSIFFEDFLV